MEKKIIHLESFYIIKAPCRAIYDIMTDFENLPRWYWECAVFKKLKQILEK